MKAIKEYFKCGSCGYIPSHGQCVVVDWCVGNEIWICPRCKAANRPVNVLMEKTMRYLIRLKGGPEQMVDVPEGGCLTMGPKRGSAMDHTPHDTVKVFKPGDEINPIAVFNDVSYFREV